MGLLNQLISSKQTKILSRIVCYAKNLCLTIQENCIVEVMVFPTS